MIGVLIVTHGKMGEGIVDAVEMICGTQEKFDYLSLERETDLNEFQNELRRKIIKLDDGDGVIILVDLIGATPMNQSAVFMEFSDKIEIVTGLNLGLAISILMNRENEKDLDNLIKKSIYESKETMVRLKEIL